MASAGSAPPAATGTGSLTVRSIAAARMKAAPSSCPRAKPCRSNPATCWTSQVSFGTDRTLLPPFDLEVVGRRRVGFDAADGDAVGRAVGGMARESHQRIAEP